MGEGIHATTNGRAVTTAQPAAAPRAIRAFGACNWVGVRTLLLRELSRFLKEWLETVVAPAFSAILYLAVFAFALGPDRATPEGQAVLRFILPGLVLFAVLERAAETTVFTLVYDKLEGVISDVLMPPLTASELVAAYALAGAVAGLVTGTPVLAVAVLGLDMPVGSPLLVVAFAAGGALMLSLTGILVGLWSAKWDHATAFFAFLLIPLTFLSGLFAPVDLLPSPLPEIVRLNPIFYVIDGFRAGALGIRSAPVGLSLAVVGITILALWILCDRLVARGWKLKP